jgi:hypothetical protein
MARLTTCRNELNICVLLDNVALFRTWEIVLNMNYINYAISVQNRLCVTLNLTVEDCNTRLVREFAKSGERFLTCAIALLNGNDLKGDMK